MHFDSPATFFVILLYVHVDINDCNPDPCENGGSCDDEVNDYDCECPPEWMGKDCDVDVDECSQTPRVCENGGTCNNIDWGYNCNCPDFYNGDNCETCKYFSTVTVAAYLKTYVYRLCSTYMYYHIQILAPVILIPV